MSFGGSGGGSSAISGASDVVLSNPANGNVLGYNSSTLKWNNNALTSADVGLNNVDNTSDATKNSDTATLTNKTISGSTNTVDVRDDKFFVSRTNDATVKVRFLPSASQATSTTASLTLPTANGNATLVSTSATQTLTNKTIDGTGNTISNLAVSMFAGAAVVTQAEGLASSNNDTSIPTTAAVKAYADSVGSGGGVTVNPQATDYTLVLADAGAAVEMDSTSNRTVTVPPNSSVAFPTGTITEVARLNTGSVYLSPGAGVTVLTSSSLHLRTANSTCTLRKRGTDSWLAAGDFSPPIAYDAASAGATSTSSAADLSFSLNIASDAGVVIAALAVGHGNSSSYTTWTRSATCGGVPMTELGVTNSNTGTPGGFVVLFGLVAPPTGTQTIVLSGTKSGVTPTSLAGSAMSYRGAASFGTAVTGAINSGTPSVSVTAPVGAMTVCALASGSSISGGTQTQRYQANVNGSSAAGNLRIADASSTGASVAYSATANGDCWGWVAIQVQF